MSANNRVLRRTMAASLTAATLTWSGMATAQADEEPHGTHGNAPAHAHAGGAGSQAQGKGNQGNQGNQGTQGHEGNPGHQGSKGGNQGQATPGGPAQPSKGGPSTGGGSPQPATPGDSVKGNQHNPPGNNGTVKIEQLDADGIPQNNPHLSCQLRVEWYGFDEGDDVISQVSFAPQAPTSGSTISVDGNTSVPVGGDPASGAGTPTGLDGSEVYTLSFTGAPHPQQGYHVKLTVHTPYSLGNDSKTKVFWVEPCAGAGSTASAPYAPQATSPGQDAPGQSTAGTAPHLGNGSGTTSSSYGTTSSGPGATITSDSGTTSGSDSVAVPTAVDAGTEGSDTAQKALPFGLLALASAATAATVLIRRRAAQH